MEEVVEEVEAGLRKNEMTERRALQVGQMRQRWSWSVR